MSTSLLERDEDDDERGAYAQGGDGHAATETDELPAVGLDDDLPAFRSIVCGLTLVYELPDIVGVECWRR